jgi:hypothetical protein
MKRVEIYLFLDSLKKYLKTQGKFVEKSELEKKIQEFEKKHFNPEKYIQKDMFE